jgi:hypothetical protein
VYLKVWTREKKVLEVIQQKSFEVLTIVLSVVFVFTKNWLSLSSLLQNEHWGPKRLSLFYTIPSLLLHAQACAKYRHIRNIQMCYFCQQFSRDGAKGFWVVTKGKNLFRIKTMTEKGMVKGKVNLSLCLTKHHDMKAYWGSGGIAPCILLPRH